MVMLVATTPVAQATRPALQFAGADGGTLCLQPVDKYYSRLRHCSNARGTIPLGAKAATLLSMSAEVVPIFSSTDRHQTRLTMLVRIESNW